MASKAESKQFELLVARIEEAAGRKKVFWVSLSMLVSYETRSFALDEGVHHMYEGPDRRSVQVSSFEGEILGTRGKFEFQSSDAAGLMARLKLDPAKKKV